MRTVARLGRAALIGTLLHEEIEQELATTQQGDEMMIQLMNYTPWNFRDCLLPVSTEKKPITCNQRTRRRDARRAPVKRSKRTSR